MPIPGISTGGGGLQNSSSAASDSGDILGGNTSFSFAGPNINRGIPTEKLLVWGLAAVSVYVIFKGVRRG
jgi:hypothetical protein